MTTSNRQIMKAAVSSKDALRTAGAGGLLGPEQADRFIDYLVDSSVLLKRATVYRLTGDSRQLDDIGVSNRVIRKGIEAQDPGYTVGATTGRRELTTEEVVLPFDITYQFLEDNIEKENAEDHVARLMAGQFANDTEDLAINGDVAAKLQDGITADPFLTIKNGWLTIADADSRMNKHDHNNSSDYVAVMRGMLGAMPEQWKRNTSGLVYLVSPDFEEGYRLSVAVRQTSLGDKALVDGSSVTYAGIPVLSVPYLAGSDAKVLCNPANLAYGIKRAIRVERQVQPRRRLIEYTMTARIGFEWHNPAAVVLSRDYV